MLRGAFRRLERTLVRRRLTGLERRLAIEIAALLVLVWGFLFWQSRTTLTALAVDRGPTAVVVAVGSAWLAIAGTVGGLAGTALTRALRNGPPGLAWLSLPIPPAAVLRHLAWDARQRALWPALLGPPIVVAAVGRVPPGWLVVLTAALPWLVIEAARIGCAIAWRVVRRKTEARSAPPLYELFDVAAGPVRVSACPPAAWRRVPRAGALALKDALLTMRATAVRRHFIAALAATALSAAAWGLPAPPAASHLIGLALALVSAAAFGEWLIALAGADPFLLLRAQPCPLGPAWSARAAWALGAGLLLGGVQLAASGTLQPHARQLLAGWVAIAAFVISLLAVHYGLTLYPRTARAAHMLSLTLGLAMAASLMIPLAGWIVLLTALVHSAQRLPRWARLEPTS